MKNKKNIILGSGPLGIWVAKMLVAQGRNVTIINQSGVMPYVIKGITLKSADLNDAKQVYNACKDANYVFHCAIPPYTQWHKKLDYLTQGIIKGLENTSVKLIYGDNLYMYGDTNGEPVTEKTTYHAKSKKGKVRTKAANDFLNSNIDVVIVRASDFYGPYVNNSMFGFDFFKRTLAGDTVNLLGNIDKLHTLTYIKDFAKTMITLSQKQSTHNQVWHVPNAPTITIRQWLTLIEKEINKPLKKRVAGKKMVAFLGIFNPMVKEAIEMMYQWDKNFIVKHDKYKNKLGEGYTEHKDAIRETVQWVRIIEQLSF